MADIAVQLGEVKISRNADDVLVCYGLGSCVAVCLYDHHKRVGGMFHCVLPKANGNRRDAKFADIGIDVLIEEMKKIGCYEQTLQAKIAGGARVLRLVSSELDIGAKNISAVKDVLRGKNIRLSNEDVGGNFSRTVKLCVENGSVSVKSKLEKEKQL